MRNFDNDQNKINSYRDITRAQFEGQPFKIDSNAYGLRVECTICHESATLNPEMWMRNHTARCEGRYTEVNHGIYRFDGFQAQLRHSNKRDARGVLILDAAIIKVKADGKHTHILSVMDILDKVTEENGPYVVPFTQYDEMDVPETGEIRFYFH